MRRLVLIVLFCSAAHCGTTSSAEAITVQAETVSAGPSPYPGAYDVVALPAAAVVAAPTVWPEPSPPPSPVDCAVRSANNLSGLESVCVALRPALDDDTKRATLMLIERGIVAACDFLFEDAERYRLIQYYLPLLNDEDFDTQENAEETLADICRSSDSANKLYELLDFLKRTQGQECPKLAERIKSVLAKCTFPFS